MANPVSLSNEARYPFLVPGGRGPDDLSAGAPPRLSLWQRLLLVLPRLKRDQEKAPLTGGVTENAASTLPGSIGWLN